MKMCEDENVMLLPVPGKKPIFFWYSRLIEIRNSRRIQQLTSIVFPLLFCPSYISRQFELYSKKLVQTSDHVKTGIGSSSFVRVSATHAVVFAATIYKYDRHLFVLCVFQKILIMNNFTLLSSLLTLFVLLCVSYSACNVSMINFIITGITVFE